MTNDMTQDILYTIKNPRVTFRQRLKDMAKIAENSVELVEYTEKSKEYFASGAMMDMFEGKTPYRKDIGQLPFLRLKPVIICGIRDHIEFKVHIRKCLL